MFTSKKRLTELREEIIRLKDANTQLASEKEQLNGRNIDLQDKLDYEQERYEELLALSTETSDKCKVTFEIDDNLTKITPVIKWKDSIVEKMIEAGYLKDANVSKTAVQLGLMAIASEALEQILTDFVEPMRED